MITVPLATPTRMGSDETFLVDGAVRRVLESSRWILGEEVTGFEEEFARYVRAPEVVGVGNGTDALALAFLALEIPPGSEVIVCETDGGYGAVAARMVGLIPVPMEVDPHSFAPTAELAAQVLTTRTRALVVTHLHGTAVPLLELDHWRRGAGLHLIEDCAHAHGLRVDGHHVGTTGDIATFSFYPTKNLGTVGDAGALVFSGSRPVDIALRARELREYGWREKYRPTISGGRNTRMDEIHAAVLRARLPFLDARNDARRRIWERYSTTLASGERAAILGAGQPGVAHQAVVITASQADRDDLAGHLADRGIATGLHYPWLVSEMFRDATPTLGRSESHTASSLKRDRTLTIPCTPELTEEEVAHVDRALSEWSTA